MEGCVIRVFRVVHHTLGFPAGLLLLSSRWHRKSRFIQKSAYRIQNFVHGRMIGNAHLIEHALLDSGHAAQARSHLNRSHLAGVAVTAPFAIKLAPRLIHGRLLGPLLFGRIGRHAGVHVLNEG